MVWVNQPILHVALHGTQVYSAMEIAQKVKGVAIGQFNFPQKEELFGVLPSSYLIRFIRLFKSRLKSRNACYHSVQNFLSSRMLSKNTKIKIYRTINLPVVLYGCETWSLTLREEHRLRVLENRVLRRGFGPNRDEVTGKWRNLHNEELNDLYSSPNIVWVSNQEG
jgi:hypothetical protein